MLGVLISLFGIIPVIGSLISFIGGLALLIPSLAVGARRLHDIDKTGWWQALLYPIAVIGPIISIIFLVVGLVLVGVILLIVTVGAVILFVYWFTKPGDKGPNRFGEDPRQVYEPIHQPAKR